LGAGVDHDPCLVGQLGRSDSVAEHQEPHGFHAEVAGGSEMLHCDVRFGAVGRDAGDGRADLVGMPQVLDGPESGQEQDGDLGGLRFLRRGGDEVELADAGEAVVEAGPAEPVAVGDLDDLDVTFVQRVDDGADLLFGELVGHGVRAVAQRGVGEADAGAFDVNLQREGRVHALAPCRCVVRCSAMRSPTWAAAAVMMSRFPE
jgi:hypothetical protein